MSGLMHDIAGAALPVAIGLLILAAAARAILAAPVADAPGRRLARLYLEPLSLWCLGALAVHTVALGAAGELSVGSLVLALALGAAAAALWAMSDAGETAAPARPARRPPAARAPRPAPAPPPAAPAPATAAAAAPSAAVPAPPAVPPARAPAPGGRLWADPPDDEAARRNGLWSRA